MENDNRKGNIKMPYILISNISFEDFIKICKQYSNILSTLNSDKTNNFFNKEDILVINDIINEIIFYSKELLNNDFINEAKEIIDIGINISDNFYQLFIKEKKTLTHPLKMKLLMLEANFNLNFKYLKDNSYSEKILLKIIEIQKILQLSKFNLGSSYFYLGIIYFFMKKFEESEKIIKLSQKYFIPIEFELNNESILIKKDDFEIELKKEKTELIPYELSLKKSSNVLRVLAEIYLLKKEYIKSINCIENAYYLYFEAYGVNYGYTIFLRNKFIYILNKIKNYLPIDYKLFINYEKKEICNGDYSFKNNDNFLLYKNNSENKIIKGRKKYFAYKIENTTLYQPLIISIYSLDINRNNNDIYSFKNLIKTFYFNKKKLLNFFEEENANNAYFYSDKNIFKIVNAIEFKKNNIFIFNKKLKSCLIWNNIK